VREARQKPRALECANLAHPLYKAVWLLERANRALLEYLVPLRGGHASQAPVSVSRNVEYEQPGRGATVEYKLRNNHSVLGALREQRRRRVGIVQHVCPWQVKQRVRVCLYNQHKVRVLRHPRVHVAGGLLAGFRERFAVVKFVARGKARFKADGLHIAR